MPGIEGTVEEEKREIIEELHIVGKVVALEVGARMRSGALPSESSQENCPKSPQHNVPDPNRVQVVAESSIGPEAIVC